ncbi:MAG: hypothetical protein CK429_06605 [Mycobacterium sp.]|nr:MAG: hypothetical protein CK429_06605 [Mycobacterium sp.]
MTIEEFRAGLHAWRNRASSVANCLWRDGVELKEKGRKFKAVSVSYFGSDPENPSGRTLELKEAKKQVFGVGYDFDNPENKFTLHDEEIDVLKAFLNDRFDQDGYYVRVDDSSAAAVLKDQLQKLSADGLAEVLSALADKNELVEAIRKTGSADFLTDQLVGWRNLETLETLQVVMNDPKSLEEDFRKILRDNPWMFGGQFVGVDRTRHFTTLDQLDIVLITTDGSLHIVELKKAYIPKLVVEHRNHHIPGPDVHEAVAQTQNYLKSLDSEVYTIASKLKADVSRAFATVVIGDRQHNKLEISEDDFYSALRTYNSHLSRIQVITYDQLVTNAMNAMQIMFGAADAQPTDAPQSTPTDGTDSVRDPFTPINAVDSVRDPFAANLDSSDEIDGEEPDYEPPDSYWDGYEPDRDAYDQEAPF